MGYYDSQGLAPRQDIETASATTSPNNDGSWTFSALMALAAIVLGWLLISGLMSCATLALDSSEAVYNSGSYSYQDHSVSDPLSDDEFEELLEFLNEEQAPQSQNQGRPRA